MQAYPRAFTTSYHHIAIPPDYTFLIPFSPAPPLAPNWKPPTQRFLHYDALYRGVLEILREPPARRHISCAVRYMRSLQACYHPSNTLQYHRILWTKAWLDALDDQDYSEADTDDDA